MTAEADSQKADVAIVVPQRDEYQAIQKVFSVAREAPASALPDGGIYVTCEVEMEGQPQPARLAIACMDDMYNYPCLMLTERLLLSLRPQLAVLLGSACGNPRRVSVFDIVVTTDGVAYLGRGRRQGEAVTDRPHKELVSQKMRDALTTHITYHSEGMGRWKRRCGAILNQICQASLPGTMGGRPGFEIKSGLIASDDLVLSWADEKQARDLWAKYVLEEARAYDMESAGFSHACARRTNQPNWTVIRGISDHGIEGTEKQHRAAATIAAEWLRRFIAARAGGLLASGPPEAKFGIEVAAVKQLYALLEQEESKNRFVGKRRFVRLTLHSDVNAIRALEYAISRGGIREYEIVNPRKPGHLTTGIRLDKRSAFW